jgi:hypothetical protein
MNLTTAINNRVVPRLYLALGKQTPTMGGIERDDRGPHSAEPGEPDMAQRFVEFIDD